MTQFKTEPLIPRATVEHLMKIARIAQVSMATVTGNEAPVPQDFGEMAMGEGTVFSAASLSKPVFTYLVLKLVRAGIISLDMKNLNDLLPFKTFCDQNGFKWKEDEELNEADLARINAWTPRMILAHKTGFDLSRTNQVNHQFEPGDDYYRYSGLPLFYLQKVIEKLHEPQCANLDLLAKKYVFNPLHMHHSSFGMSSCAANSLTTTAVDYALFVQAWMNDESLRYAFTHQVSMTHDPWAQAVVPDKEHLQYVAECLGFQLELDSNGKPLTAFKTGDMGPWRAWVAIDLQENPQQRKATVYFAKGPEPDGNGHILAETLMTGYQLTHGLYWFREKYGFATDFEENWERKQEMRCGRGMGYQEHSPKVSTPKDTIDSTQKMMQLMPPKPQPELIKSLQAVKPTMTAQQQEEKKDRIHEEQKFNPTPLGTHFDPYKH